MRWNKNGQDRGSIMIEGLFGVLACVFIMTFMLSFGFYLYQHTVLSIVANEIAEEVVMTYKYKDVDDCSEITVDKVKNVGRYRNLLFASQYESSNEEKGTALANIRLSKTALAKEVNAPVVEIERVGDDVGRIHYAVTLSQKYEFMLGDILKIMGFSDAETISSTVYVEAVDISSYINTVKMTNYGLEKIKDINPFLKTLDAVIRLMNSVYSFF